MGESYRDLCKLSYRLRSCTVLDILIKMTIFFSHTSGIWSNSIFSLKVMGARSCCILVEGLVSNCNFCAWDIRDKLTSFHEAWGHAHVFIENAICCSGVSNWRIDTQSGIWCERGKNWLTSETRSIFSYTGNWIFLFDGSWEISIFEVLWRIDNIHGLLGNSLFCTSLNPSYCRSPAAQQSNFDRLSSHFYL